MSTIYYQNINIGNNIQNIKFKKKLRNLKKKLSSTKTVSKPPPATDQDYLKRQKRISCFCEGIVVYRLSVTFIVFVLWAEQSLPLLRGLATPGLPSYLPSCSSSPPSSSPSPPCPLPGEPGDTMTGVLEMTVFRWFKMGADNRPKPEEIKDIHSLSSRFS